MTADDTFAEARTDFANCQNKINFAMKTERKGKIDVKEKFGDYLMDISKYVFTAVIVTTLFNEIVATQYLVYVIGMVATIITLVVALFYFYK